MPGLLLTPQTSVLINFDKELGILKNILGFLSHSQMIHESLFSISSLLLFINSYKHNNTLIVWLDAGTSASINDKAFL